MHSAALLADLVLLVHAGFVLFVLGGQMLILSGWIRGWRWTRAPAFRIGHLAAIGVVMVQAWVGAACPLTVWEDALRRAAGQEGYATSFIGYWISRLLFWSAPAWVFSLIYSAFGLLVVLTFLLYPPRRVWKR